MKPYWERSCGVYFLISPSAVHRVETPGPRFGERGIALTSAVGACQSTRAIRPWAASHQRSTKARQHDAMRRLTDEGPEDRPQYHCGSRSTASCSGLSHQSHGADVSQDRSNTVKDTSHEAAIMGCALPSRIASKGILGGYSVLRMHDTLSARHFWMIGRL